MLCSPVTLYGSAKDCRNGSGGCEERVLQYLWQWCNCDGVAAVVMPVVLFVVVVYCSACRCFSGGGYCDGVLLWMWLWRAL